MSHHAVIILENAVAPVSGNAFLSPSNQRSFQAVLVGTGAVQVDAVVNIDASNDGVNWISTPLGTITLTSAQGSANDGFVTDAPWLYFRATIISISGVGAKIKVLMGE